MDETTTTTSTAPRSQMSVAFKYSMIGALLGIVYFLILYLMKMETDNSMNWLGDIIPIVITFLCIKEYRNKDLGGYITFGKAFSTGMLMNLFAALINTAFFLVFISLIDTSFVTDIQNLSMQKLQEQGMSQDQIDQAMKYTKMFTSPGVLAIFTVVTYCFVGLIISLIEALILKKDNPEMPQA